MANLKTNTKFIVFSFLTVVAVSAATFSFFSEDKLFRKIASDDPAERKVQKTIFIAADGLSRENFEYAREKLGYFKMFNQVANHVAPFPSISDYSWNIMMRAREVNGQRGAIGHYEGNFYDYRHNELMADPREYFRRIGSSDMYFNGFFDFYLNPYIEALLYFPTDELPKMELKQLQDSIFESGDKPLVMAMVASVDALAHTRVDSLGFLKDLDVFLKEIKSHYDQKGIRTEIILVSDHGQASRVKTGEELQPLLPINFKATLERAGLKQSSKLINPSDVVVPVMALGNYVTVSFQELAKRKTFIHELKQEVWFEQAFYVAPTQKYDPKKMIIMIFDKDGEAKLDVFNYPANPSYEYTPVTGNPLAIPEDAHGSSLSDAEARELTLKTRFPDSFFRLAQMGKQEEAEMPDLIFTTTDAYRVSGQFDKLTTIFQTHGSLSERSTLGIVATTSSSRKLGQYIRTKDVLDTLSINPNTISKSQNIGFNSRPSETYKLISGPDYKGIETGAGSYTNERIFGIINNAVNYSSYVFDLNTVDSLASVFTPILDKFLKTAPNEQSVSELNLDLHSVEVENVLGPKDFGIITDLILKHGDIEKIQKDKKFTELRARLTAVYEKARKNKEAVESQNPTATVAQAATAAAPYSRAIKRITMKGYSSTFLLDKALTMQEFPYIDDDRNLKHWQEWEENRQEVISKPDLIKKDPTTVRKLFSEIFKEQRHLEDIAPLSLPLLYNRTEEDPKDVTIVYVPGIYNSIFDNEIFQIGLDSIAQNLGARIIEAPVLSACSSEYNSDLILKALHQDMKYRTERNLAPSRYFIIGYSKGGMDSLHALAKADPDFVKQNITGLLTIASPLAGTSILNRTDLPITLLELLSAEKIPEVCLAQEKAASSITPNAAMLFMQKNSSKLIGLTRYYSLSFNSNIKDAHIFMKATKDIAGFTEANDGVVSVSSSKFPDNFNAVDLGVVEADHLAGIVASKFPQQAFMQSVYLTLLELNAFNHKANAKFNELLKYQSPMFNGDYHIGFLSKLLGSSEKIDQDLKKVRAISQSERKAIAKRLEDDIKKAVKDTPYETKDFSFNITRDGKVEIVFAKPVEDRRFYMFWKTKDTVEVDDAENILNVLLTKLQRSGKNLLAANVELWRTYPVSGRAPIALPPNDLGYDEDFRINLRELDKIMKGKKITPVNAANYPQGLRIIYDHRRVSEFRKEYQMNYESTAPLMSDDSETSGWATVLDENKNIRAKLVSTNSSIRMTTYALRFKPQEFPFIHFDLKVSKGVSGANVLFGGSGKDDSAFQIWFTLRELKPNTDRSKLDSSEKMRLFGYYFGDQVKGTVIKNDEVYENYYSKKNFIIAVLPEAKQIPIGVAPDDLRKSIITTKNFLADLSRAFPDFNPENFEVVGITLQHDSNDTKGSSEAYFKEINFLPKE
jgi:hypothetical protein